MKKWFYLLIILAACSAVCSSVWADDAADQAEAQSRGVSVDTIRLEHAHAKNDELRARVKQLQVQLKAHQPAAPPANPALVDSLNKQINAELLKIPNAPAIGTAQEIAPPRAIIVGMSFDDAKKVFVCPDKPAGVKEYVETSWQLQSSDKNGEDYFCVCETTTITPQGTEHRSTILARVHVRDGKIQNCLLSQSNMARWRLIIQGYNLAGPLVGPSYGPTGNVKLSTPATGMSLEQVLATFAYTPPANFPYTLYSDWQKQSSDVRGDRYVCTWGIAKLDAAGVATRFPPQGEVASVVIKNGKVTQLHTEQGELSRFQSMVTQLEYR